MMTSQTEPQGTLLVLAPLCDDGGVQTWQLTYVNNITNSTGALMVYVYEEEAPAHTSFCTTPCRRINAALSASAQSTHPKPALPGGDGFRFERYRQTNGG